MPSPHQQPIRAALAIALLAAGAPTTLRAEPLRPGDLGLTTLRSELPAAPAVGRSQVRFELAGASLTFDLEPISVRSTDFQLLVQQPGGALLVQTPAAPKTVRGTVLELPDSLVAGTVNAAGLTALVIDPNGPDFWLDPDPLFAGSVSAPGAAYRFEVLPEIHPGVADTLASAPCALDGLCVAELALDTNAVTYEVHGSDANRVLDLAEGQLNILDLRYELQFKIRHHVTAVVVRTSPDDDPYAGATSSGDLLGRVNEFWCFGCQPGIRRDAAHLITTASFGTVFGKAEVNAMCGFVAGGWSSSAFLGGTQTGIMAHELGHNWGVPSTHLSNCGLGSAGGADLLAGWTCQQAIDLITARRDQVAASCLDTLVTDLIFEDDFESAGLGLWDGQVNPTSMAVVAAPAGLFGNYAVQFKIDQSTSSYLEDDSPADEKRYRARFYLNRAALELPANEGFLVFAGVSPTNTRMLEIRVRNSALGQGALDIRTRARQDDGTWSGWIETPALGRTIQVEIDWRAATAAGASDGRLDLWVDGSLAGSATGIDSDTLAVDRVRLGPSIGFPNAPNVSGALLVDAFESRRTQFIGPEP